MSTIALTMYLSANILIASITGYFFWRILTTPPAQIEEGEGENVSTSKSFDAT